MIIPASVALGCVCETTSGAGPGSDLWGTQFVVIPEGHGTESGTKLLSGTVWSLGCAELFLQSFFV